MNQKCLVLVALIGSAWAGRPFVNDDVGTVAVHDFQIESGLEIQGSALAPVFAIKHGITPYFDLGMSLSSSQLPWNADCVNGHDLMLKFALWPEHVALSSTTNLESGLTVWNGIFSQNWSAWEMHANVAAEMDSSNVVLDYGLLVRKPWQKFALGAELFACAGEKPSTQLGMQWMPNSLLNLDAGLVYGFEQKQWQTNLGITLNFGPGAFHAAE